MSAPYVTVTDAAGRVLFRRPATQAEIEEARQVADSADAEYPARRSSSRYVNPESDRSLRRSPANSISGPGLSSLSLRPMLSPPSPRRPVSTRWARP